MCSQLLLSLGLLKPYPIINLRLLPTKYLKEFFGVSSGPILKLKSFIIPLQKKYRFSVFKNASGDELMIFMDNNSEVFDRGVFGYSNPS